MKELIEELRSEIKFLKNQLENLQLKGRDGRMDAIFILSTQIVTTQKILEKLENNFKV